MNAIYVGEKRSGKTTLAFADALASGGGIIVFDPKKEFKGWPGTVSTVTELEKWIDKGERVIVWRPRIEETADESFDPLANWVMEKHALALANGWEETGEHFTLLVDEAYNLQSHAWINERLMKILSECRPEILNVFQTFQSIKNVNSDSRSRVSDWFLFTITLPSDLDRLEDFAMPEVVEIVQTLDEHEYVHFLNEKGKQNFEIVNEPESWFVSLNYEKEKGEVIEMAREERPQFPLQFESEEDYWDFHARHAERRGRDNRARDTGHRDRASDNSRGGRGGERRNSGGGERRGGFTVYKKAS